MIFSGHRRKILLGLDPELVCLIPKKVFAGYIAPIKSSNYPDLKYLGDDEFITKYINEFSFYFGFDRPELRYQFSTKFEFSGEPIIANSAVLDSYDIKSSSTISNLVYIGPGVSIGRCVKINTRSSIHHDSKIGDFSVVAPSATVCGNVKVGSGVLIGASATILPGVKIGDFAKVGAGALVNSNIEPHATYVGIPARRIK